MHHARITLLAALLLMFTASALSGGAQQPPEIKGDVVAAAKAWTMIEDGALLIDVRSPEEYAEGHIEGAVNIVHTEIDRMVALIGSDPSRPVVVYCRSGRRSGLAETALEKLGFTDVFNGTGWEALEATRP